MPNSTGAHPMLTSPVSEAYGLVADVLPRCCLANADREQMYELLAAYFDNTSRPQFEHDLSEKDTVILLRGRETGRITGFSTLMRMHLRLQFRDVIGFFSGDTIIAREHWGSSLLGRLWLRTVLGEADRIREQSPDTLFYWFLISSGYKTWRYLPIFFHTYVPHPDPTTSRFDHDVLRTLSTHKFGNEYDPDAGIVRFRRANPLRAGVADVTEPRLRDPLVKFFVRMNPGHAQGDELACLASLSLSNLTRAGLRLLEPGAGI